MKRTGVPENKNKGVISKTFKYKLVARGRGSVYQDSVMHDATKRLNKRLEGQKYLNGNDYWEDFRRRNFNSGDVSYWDAIETLFYIRKTEDGPNSFMIRGERVEFNSDGSIEIGCTYLSDEFMNELEKYRKEIRDGA